MQNIDIPDCLVPQQTAKSADGDSYFVRWISKALYTQIQCLVLLRKLQTRVDKARDDGRVDNYAERKITELLDCTTDYQLEQWLQDYTGRAVLTCSLCGTVDVDLVLETKQADGRTRLCSGCINNLGLVQLPPIETDLVCSELPAFSTLMLRGTS